MTVKDDEKFRVVAAITMKLAQLGHEVTFVEPVSSGPLITTYRFVPKAATKVAQISSCADDLALTLHVEDITIRRLPGEGVIGISVPNAEPARILWRDTLAPPPTSFRLPLNMGIDALGKQVHDDLALLPHLLVAGTTGGGKSTWLHSAIASLMYWRPPSEVEFYLSDTKQVEFGQFRDSPHVRAIARTMYTTWEIMDLLTEDIDQRLATLSRAGHRNIIEFNASRAASQPKMTYRVLVIDELADVLGGEKRGESKIAQAKLGRIVQKSRAAGVHVIAATQRPSVNIVAGSIKANFPSRLTFRLPSDVDSRTVISEPGAEHLLSRGDMLYLSANAPGVKRLHAAYANSSDITQLLNLLQTQTLT